MQYLIEGADKATGEDRTIIISAENDADLRKQVATMGILVSRVQVWQPPVAEPVGVDYARPQPTSLPAQPAPRYIGLQIAAFILGASAVFCYAGAAIVLIGALLAASNAGQPPGPGNPGTALATFSAAFGFVGAFGLFSAGAVQHGLSAACDALRDIARNSFAK